MLHSRTSIELDDEILRCVSGAMYKVLRYLVNRADQRGVCYPGNEAIGRGVDYDLRHIERIVPQLAAVGLIAYLRRNEFDPLTRRSLPNVVMINPAYICVSEAYQAEAAGLWSGTNVVLKLHPTHESGLTNTKTPTSSKTSSNNQHHGTNVMHHHQQPPTSANANREDKNDFRTPEPETDETASRETQDGSPQPTRRAASNRTTAQGSAAARLPNPPAIAYALPDNEHEKLAQKLHSLGIRMTLARGFVAEHGVQSCQSALLQTYAASETTDLKSLPGFFRSMLQENIDQMTAPDEQEILY